MSTSIDGVDYGPLYHLIGKWIGDKGLDIAPDANCDPDKSAYTDEITFLPSGPAENAEEQQLVSIRYRHVVRKKSTRNIFHDQIGHWLFEQNTGLIMHSLSIPRGVSILAGGACTNDNEGTHFKVAADTENNDFGILQSPFMKQKARTNSFSMEMTVKGNRLAYKEVMQLSIYGKSFEHVDKSTLQKVTYDLD